MTTLTHAYADLPNGMRLHYVEAGSGPLMLFVHGFPEFWYAWKEQLAEFSRDHRAVALDTRGYNLSSKPAEVADYRAKHLVEDLRLMVEHLGGKPCVIVAHDWGGALVWGLAAAHPEYVRKLVIINAPHPVVFARELRTNPAQKKASAYMNFFRTDKAERVLSEDGYRRLLAMTVESWARARGVNEEERAAYLAAWSQPGALTGGLNYYRASLLYPAEDQAQAEKLAELEARMLRVDVPTLVIWGERDQALLPGNLGGLEAHVPALTVHRITEGSHWVVHEQPERVNRLIRDFL
jgi:pimeloyl-ACP methyl ester carboxylesterase